MALFATFTKEGGLENEIEIDVGSMPSTDPLAFSFGYWDGRRNSKSKIPVKHGLKWSELAPEYIRGFLLGFKKILVPEGTKIKKGEEFSLALMSKNILNNGKLNNGDTPISR